MSFWIFLDFFNIISSFIHFSANEIILFFFMATSNSMVCTYCIFFYHSSIDGHLRWYCELVIMNSAILSINVQVSMMCTPESYHRCSSVKALHTDSIVSMLTYSPTSSMPFRFLHTLTNTCCYFMCYGPHILVLPKQLLFSSFLSQYYKSWYPSLTPCLRPSSFMHIGDATMVSPWWFLSNPSSHRSQSSSLSKPQASDIGWPSLCLWTTIIPSKLTNIPYSMTLTPWFWIEAHR